jgi:class 3 adenylate cyclase/alpha-beta hydrolase superfamily lysophospholipase
VADLEFTPAQDGIHIAYRVLDPDPRCEDPHDLVLISGGLIPMQLVEEEPGFARFLDGLRGLGRLIVFDRRGVGLSDPITDWERPVLDQWADDLAAVVEAADAHDVVVVATEGYGVGSRYVARHPERVARLVLYDPIVASGDDWEMFSADWSERVQANMRGEHDVLDVMAPSRAHDPAFREWYERAGRMGASPASAQRIWASVLPSRPRDSLLHQIAVPTLILHRRGNQAAPKGNLEYALDAIPDATLVEVDGDDVFAFVGDVDALVAEIAEFVVGERRLPPPQRLLAAVLFSDLVGSTERAASLGDAQWKAVLDRHDKAVRGAVGRCGGTVVKTTGDGVLAMFPSATGALEAAQRLPSHLVEDDLLVRVGIHVGDVDRRGDDVSGLAVNIAARVMAHAADGTLAVTASVVAAVAGQAVAFESMGSHQLKGIPGEWELFRLAPASA